MPALMLIDAVLRLRPGVLNDADSASQESVADGLLDCPHYTRPEVYQGMRVPDVLLSGHHEAIRAWRLQQALALNEAIVRRDPVNVIALKKLGVAQQCTKQFDAVIASFRSVLSLSPGSGGAHSWMCEAMLLKGDAPAALAEIEQEKSELWRLIGLPMAYYALGRKTESDAALATLIAKFEKEAPSNIAHVYGIESGALVMEFPSTSILSPRTVDSSSTKLSRTRAPRCSRSCSTRARPRVDATGP